MKINHITIPILLIAVMSMLLVSHNKIFSLVKVEFTQETEEKFDTLMNRFYENSQFSGTILIAVDEEVVYWNGWSAAVWRESVLNSIQILKGQWQKNEQDISRRIGSSC